MIIAFFCKHVFASSIIVVQGNSSPFGQKYFAGFSSSAISERVSAFRYDGKKDKVLLSQVQKMAPDLILTIGEVPIGSLTALLPSTPFIVGDYYSTVVAKKANVVMMESALPVGVGVNLIHQLLPSRTTIGTIFNPKYSQTAVDSLVSASSNIPGLKVASIKIDSPKDLTSYLPAFSGKVDIFYFIRDITMSNETVVKEIYKFVEQNNIPVISQDPTHIEEGALLTISVDPIELGEQAWNVAKVILKEGKIPQMPVEIAPSELSVSLSLKAATRFGVEAETLSQFLQKTVKDNYSVRIEP